VRSGEMYLPLLFVLVSSVLLWSSWGKTVSYTGDGSWEKVVDAEKECQWTCTPSGLVWKQKTNPYKLYNNVTACEALKKKGIKKIQFHGDSYLRHIYAAMLITLNGNYESGSMKDPKSDTYCKYHNLFNEKRCNYYNLNHYGQMCDGEIIMDPLLTGFDDRECSKEPGTVALWSFGNHPLGNQRYGVNDPVAFQKFFASNGCPALVEKAGEYTGSIGPDKKCSVWWVSTHQRVQQHFPDEAPDVVQNYNIKMREFFESGQCGNVNYIDVFNMTDSITMLHNEEAHKLTWDKVHWSYEVNLLKAQIIINALLSSE
jgi:hypothetical protein